ncbi:MAG: hypothetical protein IAE89_13815, partial [Anaerolineae bacterium]|nr:hypothetical protein [Anaerolineae bacterium]
MIYWLFTDGRELLAGLLMPLLCVAPVLLPITAAVMGAGIRRTSEEQAKPSLTQRMLLIATYAVVLLTVASLYLTVLGSQAVQRGRSNPSGIIELLVGAPHGINVMRLFLFGMLLTFLLMVTVIALHSLLRDGGWLRERLDRLRSPSVKRGALGSSHFCTLREYRRFRRPD